MGFDKKLSKKRLTLLTKYNYSILEPGDIIYYKSEGDNEGNIPNYSPGRTILETNFNNNERPSIIFKDEVGETLLIFDEDGNCVVEPNSRGPMKFMYTNANENRGGRSRRRRRRTRSRRYRR